MARFKIPGQNIDVELPDEGVIFRGVPGNSADVAFVRQGNQLLQIHKSQFQGDFNSLPQINPGLEGLEYARRFGALKDIQGQASQFQNLTPRTGEVITQTARADNPAGSPFVFSSTQGVLNKGISLAEQAARFGISSTELQSFQSTLLPSGQFAPGLLPQIPKAQVPSAITSVSLTKSSSNPFVTSVSSPSVSSLKNFSLSPDITNLELTPQEKKQQGIETQISDIMSSLTGESGFRAGQETEQKISELTRTKTDLTAQLNNLKVDEVSIQENIQKITNQAQRNITDVRGETIPLDVIGARSQNIRQNADEAIRTLESGPLAATRMKALILAAQIEATNGNLQTAYDFVDRAVKQKYDPIRAQLEALKTNLQIIQNDPETKLEDKQRALQVTAQQDARKKVLNFLEFNAKEVGQIGVKAAEAGADSQTLSSIRKIMESANPDPIEAGRIAAPFIKKSTISKGETRDTEVSQYLQSKKGADGFILAEAYQEGLRRFIASGGTQSNFVASFPQQTYLRQQEIDKLPAALRTAQIVSQKTLSADQQSIINDAKATWDAAKQTYQATPELRQKIIERANQMGFDISPYF